MNDSARLRGLLIAGILFSAHSAPSLAATSPQATAPGPWPQAYSVQQNKRAGLLTLATPYYEVQHNLKAGGAISQLHLAYGRATNLLLQPMHTMIRDEHDTVYSDVNDRSPRIKRTRSGQTEIVEVEARLLDEQQRPCGVRLKTRYVYHWGYIKVHREFKQRASSLAREVCGVSALLAPSLSSYGYRAGLSEQEKAPPFAFGSCIWGKFTSGADSPFVNTPYVPRYVMFADPDVEGFEWFVTSDLAQWESRLPGRRGQGWFLLQSNREPAGIRWSVSPLLNNETTTELPKAWSLDYYIGIPIIDGHARKPWLHASFNRNRGNWVNAEQVKQWAGSGIQTVHCHNDGDYYNDGLFWRDGSYPPYPDMERYDQVIAECHKAGIRVATYFSNKELHPSTREFQEHGTEWGRQNAKGNLQHNFYRGTNEFGAQMCLRSGWLDFLKKSIDRVLANHRLDGVYYDWNVALWCCNGRHEGHPGSAAEGHWDIDELLNLMEWTRQRVGPKGLVIVHNTTTPMFATENFADDVVANEWGYGKWSEGGPELKDLPLEWSLVGARSRGVISYGQLDSNSPKRLHRLFALEALLSGVTPWPASAETFDLYSILKPIEQIEACRFADWRNTAATLEGKRCATAIYSRQGEAFILIGNMDGKPQQVRCRLDAGQLPFPLHAPTSAILLNPGQTSTTALDLGKLTTSGVEVSVPGDSAVLLRVR